MPRDHRSDNAPESFDREQRATLTAVSVDPTRAPKTSGPACLVIIYGADLGKRIPLDETALECGRSSETAIPLDDDAVSRRHARFSLRGSSYSIADLGSTNGTYVNDQSVREAALRDGDHVKIGHTIFKFIQGDNIELSYHEEIYRMMTFDGLTRAHNKRSFGEQVDREASRSRRYRRPLSLVMFDVDHFKRINDTRGHVAGDYVLRHLASVVAANIRREDILGRVGGEEFGLLLPELDIERGAFVAEKVRAIVERSAFRYEDNPIAVTASFGVTSYRFDGSMPPSELFRLADEQLYKAKNGGRNRVCAL